MRRLKRYESPIQYQGHLAFKQIIPLKICFPRGRSSERVTQCSALILLCLMLAVGDLALKIKADLP